MRLILLVMGRLVVLFALVLAPLLHAQSSEADLRVRLVGKALYLRGVWVEENLDFDGTGKPEDRYTPGPFTLAGVKVLKVHLAGGKLVVDAQRVGIAFEKDRPRRMELTRGERGVFRVTHKPLLMRVTVAAPVSGDFGSALDAIFTDKLADLVPGMPEMWKGYADQCVVQACPGGMPKQVPAAERPAYKVGGAVSPPKVVSMKEPQFNETARDIQYSGKVLVYLQVDTEGHPTLVRVVHPIGMGLDEEAVKAVQNYVFKPAMENGVPVRVEMNVEVNFQIF